MTMKYRSITLFFLLSLSAFARIYTLKPGSESSMVGALKATSVLSEPVIVNGEEGMLEVSITPFRDRSLVSVLTPFLVEKEFMHVGGMIAVDESTSGNQKKRHLIVSGNHPAQSVIFSIAFEQSEPDRYDWPKSIPVPNADKVTFTMILEERQTVYGTYTTLKPARQTLREYANKLTDAGWKRITADRHGTTFMDRSSKHLLTFSVVESPLGSTCAVFCSFVK